MSKLENPILSEVPPASFVTAPLELSSRGRDRLELLKATYSEQFGPEHLLLPGDDELYTVFAEVVVPAEGESPEETADRVANIRERVEIATKQTVQLATENNGSLHIPVTFDTIGAVGRNVAIGASEGASKQAYQQRKFFGAVLRSTLDGSSSQIAFAPIAHNSDSGSSKLAAFTRVNVGPYFRPLDGSITRLQIRELSPQSGKAEVVEEFPLPKK